MTCRLLGMLLVMIPVAASARQATVLPDVRKPHQIVVDGSDLYVFDEADYSLHVYTLSPLTPKVTFGRKGDGPRDFKYLPYVFVRPEALVCTDFTKIIWFSRTGEVLRAMPFSALKGFDIDSEMLLVPAGDRFLRITANHGTLKRYVDLMDSAFTFIKTLYEGPFVWMQGSRTDYRTDTVASGGLVFVADTFRGFYISVFDRKGALLRTIDKSADVEEVPNRARLHQFCVSDGRIYATTYRKVDGKTEMIILDLEGRILRRVYLPLTSIRPERGALRYDLFTVGGGKLYELVQTAGKDTWELVVTDLEAVPSPPRRAVRIDPAAALNRGAREGRHSAGGGHSRLSAISGSTEAARLAGTTLAARPAIISTATDPARTAGSVGSTWN